MRSGPVDSGLVAEQKRPSDHVQGLQNMCRTGHEDHVQGLPCATVRLLWSLLEAAYFFSASLNLLLQDLELDLVRLA